MTLESRIVKYLQAGGLFNPEHMEHDKVRDLLFDCRDALAEHSLATSCVVERLFATEHWSFTGEAAAPPATQTGDVPACHPRALAECLLYRLSEAEEKASTEAAWRDVHYPRIRETAEKIRAAVESTAPTPEPTGADEKVSES